MERRDSIFDVLKYGHILAYDFKRKMFVTYDICKARFIVWREVICKSETWFETDHWRDGVDCDEYAHLPTKRLDVDASDVAFAEKFLAEAGSND